jgi:hypothetical protein
MKVLTWLSYSPDVVKYEEGSNEILTVPDQSFTVRELLENFTSNIPPSVHVYEDEGIFDENDSFAYDPVGDRDLDLVDLQQLKKTIDERIKRLTSEGSQEQAVSSEQETELLTTSPGESSGDSED